MYRTDTLNISNILKLLFFQFFNIQILYGFDIITFYSKKNINYKKVYSLQKIK